ncbi:MAG: hypothetical protein KC619_28340 [Myxococcales bacterium]|nr:hypothetical protein [Myxococcales bacterium]
MPLIRSKPSRRRASAPRTRIHTREDDAGDVWALGGGNVWHHDGTAWAEDPIDYLAFRAWETTPNGTLFAGGRGGDVIRRRP